VARRGRPSDSLVQRPIRVLIDDPDRVNELDDVSELVAKKRHEAVTRQPPIHINPNEAKVSSRRHEPRRAGAADLHLPAFDMDDHIRLLHAPDERSERRRLLIPTDQCRRNNGIVRANAP
jgi:hypothetical protein